MNDVIAIRPSTRRSRYADLSAQEMNLLLRQHTSRRAMAFFDRLTPEQRELVREGKAIVKGAEWQVQGRDELGRFQPVRI